MAAGIVSRRGSCSALVLAAVHTLPPVCSITAPYGIIALHIHVYALVITRCVPFMLNASPLTWSGVFARMKGCRIQYDEYTRRYGNKDETHHTRVIDVVVPDVVGPQAMMKTRGQVKYYYGSLDLVRGGWV